MHQVTESAKNAGWTLLRSSIREERKGLALGMGVSLVWSASRVAIPLLIQLAIDRGIEQKQGLAVWASLIAAAGVVSAVFLGLRRYVAFFNARLVEAKLRDRIFTHIQRLHFAFHDAMATGDLMSRANTDLQHFQNFITLIPLTAGSVTVVAAATVIMFVLQPFLAICALAILPLVNLFARKFAQRLHPAVMGIQRESAELASVVEESVAGIRVIKGFGSEQVQADKLAVEADDVYEQSMLASATRATFLPAMDVLPSVSLIIVLAVGGHLVLDERMSVGELVAFNIYVLMLLNPLRTLGMMVANGQRASAAGQRIHAVLATAPQIVDPAHPLPLPRSGPLGRVEFRRVQFTYDVDPLMSSPLGTNTVTSAALSPGAGVLNDLDLIIEAGESVALVGATGSGKSTVARLLPRFYDVDAGAVLLDGIDVRDLARHELRRAIAIVFEETFLFSSTIGENIRFADPEASDAAMMKAAELAGAAAFINELPDGYDTAIGERGFSLSGGQRQRLAIARAIIADPRVLILDDATSAVDPSKEHEIRDALGEVMEKRTTLVIAHRPATIALADRVIFLHEGRIAAEGTHAELLADNALYRTVLAADSESPSDQTVPEPSVTESTSENR